MPNFKDGVGATAVTFTKTQASSKIVVYYTFLAWATGGSSFNSTYAVNIGGTDYECGHMWYDQTSIRKTIICQAVISGIAAGSTTVQARWSTGAQTINAGGSGGAYTGKFYMTVQETW
jgi:hypothetical protein